MIKCLKDCPKAKPPKQFIKENIEINFCNSDTFPDAFDPPNHPYPLVVPILQDIDGYDAYIKRKRSCGSCHMHKADKETLFTVFSQSPYTYIDVAFQLTQFSPKKLEDYSDHLHFAWIAGAMRGIHTMKANKTAVKGLDPAEQLQVSNEILLDFVNLTYDAIA